jgi:hypothetical protein
MLTGIIMVIVANLVDRMGRNHIDRVVAGFTEEERKQYSRPLYDWFHRKFPDMRQYRYVSDMIDTAFIFVGLVLPIFIDDTIYQLNMMLVTTSCLYIIRIPCCMITIVPKCRVYTTDDYYQPGRFASPWMAAIHKGWFEAVNGHGHDCIFSGHCTMVVNILCHWTYHLIFNPLPLIGLWILGLFMSFWIIISRCHYWVDVFLAWCVTISFYVTCVMVCEKFHPKMMEWFLFETI